MDFVPAPKLVCDAAIVAVLVWVDGRGSTLPEVESEVIAQSMSVLL